MVFSSETFSSIFFPLLSLFPDSFYSHIGSFGLIISSSFFSISILHIFHLVLLFWRFFSLDYFPAFLFKEYRKFFNLYTMFLIS